MTTDPTCIFCKIAAGKIPSYKIYEDDVVFAFMDIGPIVTGHTLVISKAHYPNLVETPPAVLAAINERLPKLAKAVMAATGTPACHVLTNNGPEASQSVPHLHYHILPRRHGDGYHLHWPAAQLDPTAAATIVQAITAALAGQ